ncbi:hypothetical protein BKA80DRAFT_286784 [Phyllosticta citrichinensis]
MRRRACFLTTTMAMMARMWCCWSRCLMCWQGSGCQWPTAMILRVEVAAAVVAVPVH